jgi:hypothetical protein
MILHFPLRVPSGLRLTIQISPTKLKSKQILNIASGTLHSASTVVYPLSKAIANGKPSSDRVNKDKQKGWS